MLTTWCHLDTPWKLITCGRRLWETSKLQIVEVWKAFVYHDIGLFRIVFNDFTWILHDPLLRTLWFRGLESILASCMIEILLSRSKLYQVRLLSTLVIMSNGWFVDLLSLLSSLAPTWETFTKKHPSRWYLWKKTLTRKKWKSQWMLVVKELGLGKDFQKPGSGFV